MILVPILAWAVTLGLYLTMRRASRMVRAIWPVVMFVGVTAALAVEKLSPLSGAADRTTAAKALLALWWLLTGQVVVELCRAAILARGGSREARLSSDLVAAVTYIATLLAIMNFVLDLPVRGLLVTSGVIAVMAGLALQTTLADVFSGIAVGVEAPFSVGDWVSIDNLEGQVSQINWRSIHLIIDDTDIATIPNSVIAKARLINRSTPTPRRSVEAELHFPTEIVPEVAIDLLHRAVLMCPAALEAPKPVIRLAALGRRLARYDIQFYVRDSSQVGAAKDVLLRQIHRHSRAEGIGERGERTVLERASVLGIAFFDAVSTEIKQRLIELTQTHELKPGDILFREGEDGSSLFVISSGVLEVERHAGNGKPVRHGRLGPGDYLGEVGLLTGAPRGATVTALVQSRVHELKSADLRPILKEQPALMTVLEASCQKGLQATEREAAVRVNPGLVHGHLLQSIRAFLFDS